MGGLGNLIFQYMCAFNLSKKYNAKLHICYEYVDEKRDNILKYKKIFDDAYFITKDQVNDITKNDIIYNYNEPSFTYKDFPDFSIYDTVLIYGYFQSWKYFYNSLSLLRKNFKKHNNMIEYYNNISKGKETVCVHVRRGDYLNQQAYHPVMNEDYYRNNIKKYENVIFIVFAEDYEDDFMDWTIWNDIKESTVFVKDIKNPLDTFFLMSLCDNFIIANSSLSLTAYYFRHKYYSRLNFPSNWLGPSGPQFKIDDLINQDV